MMGQEGCYICKGQSICHSGSEHVYIIHHEAIDSHHAGIIHEHSISFLQWSTVSFICCTAEAKDYVKQWPWKHVLQPILEKLHIFLKNDVFDRLIVFRDTLMRHGVLDDAVGWGFVSKAFGPSGINSNPRTVTTGDCTCEWITTPTRTSCTRATHAGPWYSQRVHVASACSRVSLTGVIIRKGACEFPGVWPLGWLASRLNTFFSLMRHGVGSNA